MIRCRSLPRFPSWFSGALCAAGLTAVVAKAGPSATGGEATDFTALSFEELAAIKVTTVSKKTESLAGVPAAVSVITSEEIRRSGALTIPEALRLAPGVNVGRVSSSEWAVSVRGFNDTFAQKLLVLIDGRSVYTPLFSGTFWEAQDAMLEDVERIEVIRGPGGTVWGANAVNGVINVVSKPARETQGLLVSAGGGTDREALARVRYGVQLGSNTFVRFYGKYDNGSRSDLTTGGRAEDGWWKTQGGLRLDWEPSARDRFTLQSDGYSYEADLVIPQVVLPSFGVPPPPTDYMFSRPSLTEQDGGNVLGRWTRQQSEHSDYSVQAYYDRQVLLTGLVGERRNTYDVDLRHRYQLGDRNEVVWGGGYRLSQSDVERSPQIAMRNNPRSDQIFNAFLQDEVTLVADRLRWTLGTKIERNDYTEWEFEPGTRLAWTPTKRQTLWASVARAVRTPARYERDGQVNLSVFPADPPTAPLPTVLTVRGGSRFESETVLAYEAGYRVQAHPRLNFDAAIFLDDYDNLRGTSDSLDASDAPNFLRVNSQLGNTGRGRTYGGELGAVWHPLDWWRFNGQFSLLQADLEQPDNALTGTRQAVELASPRYQVSVRSGIDLGSTVELDAWLRFVDQIEGSGAAIPGLTSMDRSVKSYVTLDLRLGWHPLRNLEVAVVGQNLAGNHTEFLPTFISVESVKVGPSVYGKLTWKF